MLDLAQWNLVLSAASISLLAAIIVLTIRDARQVLAMRFGVLVGLSTIAMLIVVGPDNTSTPGVLTAVLRSIALGNTLFVWLFALALFQDDFQLDRRKRVIVGLWYVANLPAAILSAFSSFTPLPILNPVMSGFALLLLSHAAWVALSGRQDDLVEPRRQLRLHFVLSLVAVVAVIIMIEGTREWRGISLPIAVFRGAATLGLSFWALIWLTRLEAGPVLQPQPGRKRKPEKGLKARDRLAAETLDRAMSQDDLWREPGLTIRDLAGRINLPEHAVRKLINNQLGYRNFSAFLNSWRLQRVKDDLADPAKARLPILTIAMDAGYASLAPFNRAFKAAEGITPSAWREAALDGQIPERKPASGLSTEPDTDS